MDEHTAEAGIKNALCEHYYSGAKMCKHASYRSADAAEIFITKVIDFMFGVNYPHLR